MRKFLIILAVVLFVGEVRATNLKGKFGAGLEFSSFYYDYGYGYYWQSTGLQDLELMYGLTNNLALIVGGGMPDTDYLRLKIGLQGYVEPTKAVSPYFKVSFNSRHHEYSSGGSYSAKKIKMGAGMEYFWTEHLGLAIHTSFLAIYFGEKGHDAEIGTVPGIYFWIRK